jgi:hypothetical protein
LLPLFSHAADSPAPLSNRPSAPETPRLSGPPRKEVGYVFTILPKSFQRDPSFEMTVNTEFTDYGRLLRPATPENPIYYVTVAAGFKQLGIAMGGEHPPPPADMERAMLRALATNGFLPAEHPEVTPPSLVLVYYYGSHDNPDKETLHMFPELADKARLERAILIGGKKYAASEGRVIEWGESILDHGLTEDFLREQTAGDIYFVVASAYDYASLAKGERKLAWRTSMTVNTSGVSMRETLPPLIATAAPFFGRETPTPQIEVKKFPRKEVIEVGTPRVVADKPAKP